MRLPICAALAAMLVGPAAGQPAQQSRDEAFTNEVALILSAAACANPHDDETLRLLAVLLGASRVRNYGPDPDQRAADRMDRIISQVEVAARAGIEGNPRTACFNVGRRLERLLPR